MCGLPVHFVFISTSSLDTVSSIEHSTSRGIRGIFAKSLAVATNFVESFDLKTKGTSIKS